MNTMEDFMKCIEYVGITTSETYLHEMLKIGRKSGDFFYKKPSLVHNL